MKNFFNKNLKKCVISSIGLGIFTPFTIADSIDTDTLDEIFLSIAQEQATFAGAYKDSGQLVILTTDGKPLTNLGGLSTLDIDQSSFNDAKIENAKYSFAQLSTANDELLSYILDLPEFIGLTDIDEKSNRVVATIGANTEDFNNKEQLAERRKNLLNDLADKSQLALDTDIFEIRFLESSPSVPYVRVSPPFNNNIPSLLSALPQHWSGMNVLDVNRGNCSWGFTASLNNQRGFVHNSHCATPNLNFFGGAPTLSRVFTAFNVDNLVIAQSTVDPLPVLTSPSTATSVAGNLPAFCKERACRHSDSQFAKFESGFDTPSGYIARPNAQNTTLEINQSQPTFNITKVGGLLLMGDVVHKVGPSTGWTSGEITRTCQNAIRHNGVSQICQTQSEANVYSGDSGSPVFTIEDNGTDVRLRGIVHTAFYEAGIHDTDIVYSPISQVMKDLGTLSNITVDNSRPQPSLDAAQVPGYIHQGHIIFSNEETKTFTLDVLESGQYDISIQNGGSLDSREIEVNIGEQTEYLALDNFDSSNNLATITTEHLSQGQHTLSITAHTTDIVLRHIQAVKSGETKFPTPSELTDVTNVLQLSNFFISNTIPGFSIGRSATVIEPQQSAELDITVTETGNYELTLEFYIARNSQAIEISFNGETIRRALDANAIDIDRNPSTEVLSSTQTFKFFDVPKGELKLSIKSDATHDIVLQPRGSALTIK